ncbi:hypothetical protein P280DRAFT_488475 [Massarina eburnea CBS 473.64]|uniref:Mating-type protein MAT-1 n=1 Tax=Massarina eburnea CBS 473.64 TaxID=1395130 RepID=A0A6A6SAK9_9PLEO|nr:hypothetical protein P280DRAFT_488475 [Massarina eburnea CBS 473.64]
MDVLLTANSSFEVLQVMRAVRSPAAQAALTTMLLNAPPPVVERAAPPEKAKKALNAFVGFRCYYITIPVFKAVPMKKLSKALSTLWETDPNKPMWSLMAKAWSTMRDAAGKDQAPLDQFLRMVCPHYGIPSPEIYLQVTGLCIITGENGAPVVIRDPSNTSVPGGVGTTAAAVSVEDIIEYAQSQGYVRGYIHQANLTSSTFLGHSAGQTLAANQFDADILDERFAARNMRRDKRDATRESGTSADIKNQIRIAHSYATSSSASQPQYHVTRTTFNGIPVFDFNAPIHMSPSSFVDQQPSATVNSSSEHEPSTALDITNWSAFRTGADADVAMPAFSLTQQEST